MKKLSKPAQKRGRLRLSSRPKRSRIVRTSGKTVTQVARELDLTVTCPRSWVKQAEVDGNTIEGVLTCRH